jgi:hypothetical protein
LRATQTQRRAFVQRRRVAQIKSIATSDDSIARLITNRDGIGSGFIASAEYPAAVLLVPVVSE